MGTRIGVDIAGTFTDLVVYVNCSSQVTVDFGSDLLGKEFHRLEGGELALRAEFNRPIYVLRSATSVNAELLQMNGQLGCIQPDTYADLLVTK